MYTSKAADTVESPQQGDNQVLGSQERHMEKK